MSTRHLREALYQLEDLLREGGSDLPAKAKAELEAIEKAAKDAQYLDVDEAEGCRWWESEDRAKWDGVVEVLKSIANDAN